MTMCSLFQNFSYNETSQFLETVHRDFPELTKLYSIGKTVQGRDLLVLELSRQDSNPKPSLKLTSGALGRGAVGGQLLLKLVQHAVENNEEDLRVR